MRKIIFIFITISILSFSQEPSPYETKSLYNDISREHWAYRAVENLVYKGILKKDSDLFEGNSEVNRYEFVYYLSKVLNNLDEEKANQSDLLILENLVYEFSKELNNFGFDSATYMDRIRENEEQLQDLQKKTEANIESIENIEKRVDELEEKLRSDNFFYYDESYLYSNNPERVKYLDDIRISLDTGLSYRRSPDSDTELKERELDEYEGFYTLEAGLYRKNYELVLKSYNSDDSNDDDKLSLEAQYEGKILNGLNFNFHTKGYERFFRSQFNNIVYDNYSPEDGYDEFNSYGVGIFTEDLGIYIEKNDIDLSPEDLSELPADKSFVNYASTTNIIAKADYRYFETLVIRNGNEDTYDYEVDLKYPDLDIMDIVIGYANEGRSDYRNEYYNFESFFGEKKRFGIGYEKKLDGGTSLYDDYYGELDYKIGRTGKIKYRLEYLDTSNDSYINNRVLFRNSTEDGKVKTYFGYGNIQLDKGLVFLESDILNIDKDETEDHFYQEILGKLEYQFLPKLTLKGGYIYRIYRNNLELSSGEETDNINTAFLKLNYKFKENMDIYLSYIKNDSEKQWDDRSLDLDDEKLDIDYDGDTGIIRRYEKGKFTLGFSLTI